MPNVRALVEPGPMGVTLAATTAVCWGIDPVPRAIVGLLALATVAAACWWLRWVLSMRRRRARLTALLHAGTGPAEALTGAGIHCWAAWLELDDSAAAYTARPDGEMPPAGDLEEICLRALRHEEPFDAVLESDTFLVAAAESEGPRLVVGLRRRPSDFERSMIETAMSRTIEPLGASDPVVVTLAAGDRRSDKALRRALVSVRLGAFENVRLAGGQLLAERVIGDAEQRLRLLIRATDQLVKVDEDSFVLAVWVHDSAQLEAVRGRILSALAEVPVPRRASQIVPELRSAIGAAVYEDERLRDLAGLLGDIDWEREAS
jgi:GGDEF domain-containing protein